MIPGSRVIIVRGRLAGNLGVLCGFGRQLSDLSIDLAVQLDDGPILVTDFAHVEELRTFNPDDKKLGDNGE